MIRSLAWGLLGWLTVAVCSGGGLAQAAETLCEPGVVRRPSPAARAVPVAFHAAATPLVTIQWVGHSSFLIVTPAGIAALTDPNAWHPSPVAPDVVTISNEHPTHNQARAVPGSPRALRGRTPAGEGVEVDVTIGDLRIRSLPSDGEPAPERPSRNSIFVFRAEGLCIVHLGNLRQLLRDEQRRRIGPPDILMIPIDGQWTLSYDQVALTIAQLRPAIVLPMHYDAPEHARLFMQAIKATAPVRTQADRTLHLSRASLPSRTEVVVLGYRDG
jgi:L-ascorbate metabolism protein UlaG (beta-lactamase superfamily)